MLRDESSVLFVAPNLGDGRLQLLMTPLDSLVHDTTVTLPLTPLAAMNPYCSLGSRALSIGCRLSRGPASAGLEAWFVLLPLCAVVLLLLLLCNPTDPWDHGVCEHWCR